MMKIRSDESFISLRWLKMWKISKLTGAAGDSLTIAAISVRRETCGEENEEDEESICEYLAANRATHYASIRCIRVIRHLNSIYHTTRHTTHWHTYKPKRQLLNIHTLLSRLIITILEEYSSFVIKRRRRRRRRSNKYTMRWECCKRQRRQLHKEQNQQAHAVYKTRETVIKYFFYILDIMSRSLFPPKKCIRKCCAWGRLICLRPCNSN